MGTGPGSSEDQEGGEGRRAGRTTSQCFLWAPCREPAQDKGLQGSSPRVTSELGVRNSVPGQLLRKLGTK